MALQTADIQQPNRLTVLRTGGEIDKTIDKLFVKDKGKEAIKVAQDLRKIQPAGGRETMRAGLTVKDGETKFNVRKTTDWKERFGAGRKGAVPPSTPSEVASYKKGEQSLRENKIIALFLEMKSLSQIEQTNMLADIQVTADMDATLTSFSAIRKEALRLIEKSDSIKGLFPELDTNGLTPKQKMEFIEATLFPSDDARFAARFGTRLQDAYKKTVDLPLVGTDEERANVEKQLKLGEETIKVKRKQIEDILKAKNIKKIGGVNFNSADIDAIISTGGTPDMIGNTLVQQAYLQSTPGAILSDFDSMKKFADLPKQISEANARITAKLAPTDTLAGYKAAHASDPDVMDERASTLSRLSYLSQFGPAGTKNIQYVNFSKNFLPLLEQNSLSAVGREMRQAQIELEDAKIKKKILPPTTADIEKTRDLRILAEEDILGEIDGILGQSIADVLEERYDVMEERMGRLSEDQQKMKEIETQNLIVKLKRKMSTNWIERKINSRTKEIHKVNIKKDVIHLAYGFDKDIALKQLIARDLYGVSNFDQLNLIDGKAPGLANPLSADQLAQINKVFESNGTEYRDKLFADMFAARGFMDRSFNVLGMEGVWGNLGFKRDEWKYMMQRYEPDITKALETNREASQALKSLEAQGVKVEASTKWLLYLLAIVFGGLTGGLGGAVIPGIGATAGALTGIGAEVAATKVFTGRNTVDVNGNDNTMA